MPTLLRAFGFRFFFYPNDHPPPHVHVEYGSSAARFELDPVRMTANDAMRPRDLARAEDMVRANRQRFQDAWDGFFGPQR